ncbi:MAG: endonuclease [Ruminococcus sp.]|nr:endonuclease [Ruminococcus sp.]
MAVTEIHAIKSTLNKALDYIMNPKKTDNTLLVDGYHCAPETAALQFNLIKKNFGKDDGILGFHVIQSFSPGEVDYDTAHRLGQELADKIFDGKFQYVCATHIDRGHVHNHIIANSVSFESGNKFLSRRNTMYDIRKISDELCRENGLSVIENPKEKGRSQYERTLEKKGQSWKALLRKNIDKAILNATDFDDFVKIMESHHYEIKRGKYISFRAEGQERFTRGKTLGYDYTEERLRERVAGTKTKQVGLLYDIESIAKKYQANPYIENNLKIKNIKLMAQTYNYLSENKLLSSEALTAKRNDVKGRYDNSRERIKEIEKRLKVIAEDITNIDNYRKNKPVADKLDSVVFKDRYKREHESELIIFTAAEKYLTKRFKGKTPLIKELRAEQKKLTAEKNKLYGEYYSAKEQLAELDRVARNVQDIMGLEKEKDRQRDVQRKRSYELE